MVRKCSACGKTDWRFPRQHFYPFPQDPQNKSKWISLIGFNENEIKQLTRYSLLCSDHFNSKDMVRKPNGERFIVPGAIPIFYSRRTRKVKRRNLRTSAQTKEESSGSQICIEETIPKETIETENIECKIEVEDTILYDEHQSVKNERLSDDEDTKMNTFNDSLVNFVKIECKPEKYEEEESQDQVQHCKGTQNTFHNESTDSADTEEEKRIKTTEILISGLVHKYQHCGFKTNDRWALLKHIHETHIESIRKCEYCDYRTKSTDELKIHVESVHVSSKLLKCKICDYSCFYSFSLKAHFETVHLKRKDEECHYCDSSCSSKSDNKYRIDSK